MRRIVVLRLIALSMCALAFLAIGIPGALASTVTFGQQDQVGTSGNSLSSILGAQYTNTMAGQAESIHAYLSYTPTTGYFGEKTVPTSDFPFWSIGNEIAGQAFTSPASPVVAQSISAYFTGNGQPHKVKAAIYDASGHFIIGSEEKSVASRSAILENFELTAPTLLSASTTYIIVAWSDAADHQCNLLYNTESSNGKQSPTTYGTWPETRIFATDTGHNFFIWCNYESTANVQCAIYSNGGASQIGVTEQKTITSANQGWNTFNFVTKPALDADAQYVLAAWSSDPNVKLYYTGNIAPAFSGSGTNWPGSLTAAGENRNYNLYCDVTVSLAVVPEPPFWLGLLCVAAAVALVTIYKKRSPN